MHQHRLTQEAAAYKAEIELTMQKQRLREEAEDKIAHAQREAEMLEKEREVAQLRAAYDKERLTRPPGNEHLRFFSKASKKCP